MDELPKALAPEEPKVVPIIESVLPTLSLNEGFLSFMVVSGLSDELNNEFPARLTLLKGGKGELKEVNYVQANYKQLASGVAHILNSNPEMYMLWKSNIANSIRKASGDDESTVANESAESFLTEFIKEFIPE